MSLCRSPAKVPDLYPWTLNLEGAWAGVDRNVSLRAGNAEIGRCIVPHPHIRQIVVPAAGARLILGSDGLWDPLATSKVFSLCQKLPLQAAARCLCNAAYRAQVCLASTDNNTRAHCLTSILVCLGCCLDLPHVVALSYANLVWAGLLVAT